ncbi:MAG: cytochrome c [Halothiobacillaceae bacterium]|nr:cytochrome c [Halothiobacillaceae bacterium]
MNSAMPPVLSRRQTPQLLGVCILTLAGLVVSHSAAAEAHDPNWGAQLHAEHCAGCHTAPHDAAFYESRQGKKIQSLASLRTMVESCANHFNIAWFEEENEAVTKYLNVNYYKFK